LWLNDAARTQGQRVGLQGKACYGHIAIDTHLMLRDAFKIRQRETAGLMESVLTLLHLVISAPAARTSLGYYSLIRLICSLFWPKSVMDYLFGSLKFSWS
jgi:hypothetical protein